MVVGNAEQLSMCSKGPKEANANDTQVSPPIGAAAEKPREIGASKGEGVFSGMERISPPKGSVMVWSSAQALNGEVQSFPMLYAVCSSTLASPGILAGFRVHRSE